MKKIFIGLILTTFCPNITATTSDSITALPTGSTIEKNGIMNTRMQQAYPFRQLLKRPIYP